jgi:chemotaxis regulatin CheY-phosphate phosphatase CheZ
MDKNENMVTLFERLNDLKDLFRYGQKLVPVIHGLIDFMRDTVPLLENINSSITESTSKIPKAANQINSVTTATELATTEILDLVDRISVDISDMQETISKLSEDEIQKIKIFNQIKDLLPKTKESAILIEQYESLSNIKEPIELMLKKAQKIKDDAINITLSLQVQDITSQQLAAVKHLIGSVQVKLSSLINNLSETHLKEFEGNKSFDPDADYAWTEGRQDVVNDIINNHQASQEEIDKLFS